MVLFFSLALVIIALVLLVVGVLGDGVGAIYASIVAVLASGAVLGAGVLLQRRQEAASSSEDPGQPKPLAGPGQEGGVAAPGADASE